MNLPEDSDTIVITEDEAGERLDKILAQRFRTIQSRTYFQTLIEEGNVLVNGAVVKKRTKPVVGDEVQVNFSLTKEIDILPENIPLDILYEDQDIIVINKPAGMVVHPAVGNWTGTFVNALMYHCQEIAQAQSNPSSQNRPGIVHRLDKDTTGLLVAAKTALAQQRLIEMFASRNVYKQYIAICLGNPGFTRIEAPIARHPVHRKLMAVATDGGRQALTICQTKATDGKISVVEIELATGRTHQIRVHMKHNGTAVLGDNVYGNSQVNKKYGAERQLLHAHVLRFAHPITGVSLEFKAPIPDDMARFIAKI